MNRRAMNRRDASDFIHFVIDAVVRVSHGDFSGARVSWETAKRFDALFNQESGAEEVADRLEHDAEALEARLPPPAPVAGPDFILGQVCVVSPIPRVKFDRLAAAISDALGFGVRVTSVDEAMSARGPWEVTIHAVAEMYTDPRGRW